MSAPAPAGERAPFDSYEAHWLAAQPEWRVARLFLPQARDARFVALCVLGRELREAAFGVRDPGVAQAKLGWWLEELQRSGSAPRHPVTRRLHELGHGAAVAAREGQALAAAALGLANLESPADLAALLQPFRNWTRAQRILAQSLGVSGPADTDGGERDAAAVVLEELRHWPRFVDPARARVPLDTLARCEATRDALASQRDPAAARRVARDLAATLQDALGTAHASPGDPLVSAQRLVARRLAARVRRRPDTLVQGTASALGPGLVWQLWRLGRRVTAVAPA